MNTTTQSRVIVTISLRGTGTILTDCNKRFHPVLSDRYTPKNQAERDLWELLQEAERLHKIWMHTRIFGEDGEKTRRAKDAARVRELTLKPDSQPKA